MNNLSPFTTALIIVIISCLVICMCCYMFFSYLGSLATGFIRSNIQAIPPLNVNETFALAQSIEPIIKKYLNQSKNKLSQSELLEYNNAINSNITPTNIPIYVRIRNSVVPMIASEIRNNINIIPYSIRVKLNNNIPDYMIADIINDTFAMEVSLIRGFQRRLDLINPEERIN